MLRKSILLAKKRWMPNLKGIQFFLLFVSLLAAFSLTFALPGRAATGNVTGIFLDLSDQPLADKTITLLLNDQNMGSVETDENGEFAFTDITYSADDLVTIFVEGETEKAVHLLKLDSSVSDGDLNLDLRQRQATLRSQSEGNPLSYTDMVNALGIGAIDFSDVQSLFVPNSVSEGEGIIVQGNLLVENPIVLEHISFVSGPTQTFEAISLGESEFDIYQQGASLTFQGEVILPKVRFFVRAGSVSFSDNAQFKRLEFVSSSSFTAPSVLILEQLLLHPGSTFHANGGTVLFEGEELSLEQAFSGGTANFHNLTILNNQTHGYPLDFVFPTDFTINIHGQFSAQGGDTDNLLTFQSDDDGIPFTLSFGEEATIGVLEYLQVKDAAIELHEDSSIELPLNPQGSVNAGNSNDWFGLTLSKEQDGMENGSEARFLVTAGGANGTGAPIEIGYSFTDDTAIQGNDFVSDTTSVMLLDGESEVYIEVPIVDDSLVEGTERFFVQLDFADHYTVNTESVAADIIDNDTPGIVVDPSSLTIDEDGGEGQILIHLTTQPTGSVTISASSNDTGEATVSPSSLTFTDENWDEDQIITVTGVNDWAIRNDSAQITIAFSGGPIEWNAVPSETVFVELTDDDVAGVSVSPTQIQTIEGGSAENYSVVLLSQPSANVTIDISPDSLSSVTPAQLIFTAGNWDTPQPVSVEAVDNDRVSGEAVSTIEHAINASLTFDNDYLDLEDIELVENMITDDDEPAMVVSPSSLTIDEDGGTDIFSVRLSGEPTGNVVITVSSDDTSEATVSPATLTFTSGNWDQDQSVTVTAVDDDIVRDDSASIILSVDDAQSPALWEDTPDVSVAVTITDDDSAEILVSPTSISTNEGGSAATYVIRSSTEPSGNVVISVSSDAQSSVSLSQVTLTSSNWEDGVEVSVTAVDDDFVESATHLSTISHAVNNGLTADNAFYSLAIPSVTNTITDNDSSGLVINPTSLTIDEGDSGSFTVRLAARPQNDVVLSLASSDDNVVEVSPSSVTFTSNNWSSDQTVTLSAPENSGFGDGSATITIAVDDDQSDAQWHDLASESVSVTVTDNDVPEPTPTPTPIPSPSPKPSPQPSGSAGSSEGSASGNSSAHKEAVCTAAQPGGVPDLFQITMTNNQAQLFFAPVSQPVTRYVVRYGTKAGEMQFASEFSAEDSSGVVSAQIGALANNMQYFFSVRAMNDCSPGEWGNELSARTGASQASFHRDGSSSGSLGLLMSEADDVPSLQREPDSAVDQEPSENQAGAESSPTESEWSPIEGNDSALSNPGFFKRLWMAIQSLFTGKE